MSLSIYDTELPYRIIVVEDEGRTLITDLRANDDLEKILEEFRFLGYGVIAKWTGRKTVCTVIMTKPH